MSDMNSFNSYSSDSDLCPNCGAMKMFSALVCPSCGMDYTEAARQRAAKMENAATEPVKPAPVNQGGFDPNAAFRKFKSSLEENADTPRTDSADSASEPSKTQTIVEEPAKPVDPIAKKLSELNSQNSAMYGERVYRVNNSSDSDPAKQQATTPGYGATGPGSGYGATGPGAGNGATGPGSRYGGAVWQSGTSPSQPNYNTQRQFSSEVSNRYEEYRSGIDNSLPGSQYATPYSRGSFDAIPEKKPSTFKKILPLLIVLILIGAGTYAFLYVKGLEANENGVKYSEHPDGILSGDVYTNEWAEMRIQFDLTSGSSSRRIITGNSIGTQMGLSQADKEKFDFEIFYVEGTGVGFLIFNAKTGLLGKTEEEFFEDDSTSKEVLGNPNMGNYTVEPDMLLGDKVYKCRSLTMQQSGVTLKCYYAVRSIGNRIVSVVFYDNPNNSQLGRLKAMFKKY